MRMEELSDKDLVVRIRDFPDDGNRVLGLLYRRHRVSAAKLASVYLVRYRIDNSYAEDIVQIVFETLLESLQSLNDPLAFEAFLRRMVRNRTISFCRKHSRHDSTDPAELDRIEIDASRKAGLNGEEFRRWCVDNLSDREARITNMYFFEGSDYSEIAKREGIKTGSVGWYLSEIRRKIRKFK